MTATNPHTQAVALTVGHVCERFGVTVRTLHHYDEIGLVVPGERSVAGYRLYTEADLDRLARVLVFRRLGFGLEDIATLLDADGTGRVALLQRRREAVMSRLGELSELVTAIDHVMEAEMNDHAATPQEMKELFGSDWEQEMKELFGSDWEEDWADEVQERWGNTEAYRQHQERTRHYTKADWVQVKQEADAIDAAFVTAFDSGAAADSRAAMDAAEEARVAIERFYDVSYSFHRCLADMYLSDQRFTDRFERIRPGMARYVHDAIHANADRHSTVQ